MPDGRIGNRGGLSGGSEHGGVHVYTGKHDTNLLDYVPTVVSYISDAIVPGSGVVMRAVIKDQTGNNAPVSSKPVQTDNGFSRTKTESLVRETGKSAQQISDLSKVYSAKQISDMFGSSSIVPIDNTVQVEKKKNFFSPIWIVASSFFLFLLLFKK